MKKIRTQKAAGIMRAVPILAKSIGVEHGEHILIQSVEDIESSWPTQNKQTFFARPCPVKPKHGFVDSCDVKSKYAAKELFKKVLEYDAKGELLLGPKYSRVSFNAVCVTSGLLSIGPGHDGATAGKNSISLPIAPFNISKKLLKSARIADGQAVYVEAIYGNRYDWNRADQCYITQMRAGPHIDTGSPDFVPEDILVKEVVLPVNDLILWAEMAAKFAPGTVVFGDGYTLSSHAAVHCILHGIPFVTTKVPVAGQMLKKSCAKSDGLSRAAFKKGASLILKAKCGLSIVELAQFSLAVLHNWAYIRNHSSADWITGAALAALLKVGAAICHGEMRHHCVKGRTGSREQVYENIIDQSSSKNIANLRKAIMMFSDGSWESGFGGIPWAMCCHYMIELNNAISSIVNSPGDLITGSEIAAAMDVYNKIINLEHNGGWWFNKILDKSTFDAAAKEPAQGMIVSADVIYKLHKHMQKDVPAMCQINNVDASVTPFLKTSNGHLKWLIAYESGKVLVKSDDEQVKSKELKFRLSAKDIDIISKRLSNLGADFYNTPLAIKERKVMISKSIGISFDDIGI